MIELIQCRRIGCEINSLDFESSPQSRRRGESRVQNANIFFFTW